ncbi:MAG: hypothetical protein RIE08_00070 [Acidimicrobiales bacterium]
MDKQDSSDWSTDGWDSLTLYEDFLVNVAADWVSLGEMSRLCRVNAGDDAVSELAAIGLAVVALAEGFVEAGEIEGAEFSPWRRSLAGVVEELVGRWGEASNTGWRSIGDTVWLTASDLGIDRAEQLRQRIAEIDAGGSQD